MPKKISECTKAHLISVPLPNHAATYTVISHQFVIDYAYQALANAGFGIVEEEYRCTSDGQIAQGIYKLQFMSDPELSMMFAWTNSYNKQVKFKCVVGAYINNTGSVMISGEVGSWVRKHMGTADTETKDTIDKYISNAHMYYDQLCLDKAAMEGVTLNTRKQAQLLGVLFAEYGILTTEQASMVRDQMKKPVHVFADSSSLWAFYNYVTVALQLSHPKTWMEDQRILHYFISTIGNFSKPAAPVQTPVIAATPVDPLTSNYGQPENQTNLLVQIAEVTGDESVLEPTHPAEQEIKDCIDEVIAQYPLTPDNAIPPVQEEVETEEVLHQSEEVVEDTIEDIAVPFDIDEDDDAVLGAILTPIEHKVENPIVDTGDSVKYTDPAGNTFEAPIVGSLEPTPEDHVQFELEEANLDTLAVIEKKVSTDADFDLDFNTDDSEEDEDEIPDFF
jgi:hypothetical protein